MFIEKITAKLKTEYKSFGLSNEAYDRIASATEKTVTEESQVETAVKNAETLRLIANELQRMRDSEIQKRTDLQREHDNYKAKHPEAKENTEDSGEGDSKPDFMKTIADAIAAAVQPLTAEIAALKSSSSAEKALASAKEKFFGGDYAKKYTSEAEEAWERAVELNEATGSKLSGDELAEKANGYFNKAVSKKGVDTSKPFKADPNPADEKGTLDWSAERKRLQAQGKIATEEK